MARPAWLGSRRSSSGASAAFASSRGLSAELIPLRITGFGILLAAARPASQSSVASKAVVRRSGQLVVRDGGGLGRAAPELALAAFWFSGRAESPWLAQAPPSEARPGPCSDRSSGRARPSNQGSPRRRRAWNLNPPGPGDPNAPRQAADLPVAAAGLQRREAQWQGRRTVHPCRPDRRGDGHGFSTCQSGILGVDSGANKPFAASRKRPPRSGLASGNPIGVGQAISWGGALTAVALRSPGLEAVDRTGSPVCGFRAQGGCSTA